MPYKDNEKNKACKQRFNQSEEGKVYKHGWYVKNKNRAIASVFIGALKDSIDLLTKAVSYLKDNGIIESEVAYGGN